MRSIDGFTRGINLGGWLSQYRTYSIEHFDSFISEADIKRIASWGLDHVRVPVDYEVVENEDGSVRESGYVYIDNCIQWCIKYGIRMVLDLHKTYGYSFDPMEKTDKEIFFHKGELQERFYALWQRLASRYAKYSDVVCYELLNEIACHDVYNEWNVIATTCIKRIREVAPDNWIIYGGVDYNGVMAVPLLTNPCDDKTAFTFHCYDPFLFTHQGCYWLDAMPRDFRIGYPATIDEYKRLSAGTELEHFAMAIFSDGIDTTGPDMFAKLFEPALKKCEELNVPVYVGEYGVIDIAKPEDRLKWLKDINSVFTKYNVARAYWSYRKMDFGVDDVSDDDELIKYL